MLNELIVGQPGIVSTPPNTIIPVRGGQLGDAIVSELHGRYYEQTYRKNMFFAYIYAKVVTSLSTTATGLILVNPANSLVNLVLNKIFVHVQATSASALGIGLAYALGQTTNPGTAATALGNCFLNGPASQGQPGSACTMTNTPVEFIPILHNTAAIATTGEDVEVVDLEGSVIVPPGVAVLLNADGGASASASVTASFQWEEVPL
jgi:hypothetical protein